MDAYEATRVVFSRIQSLDPENAAKIMGLLLIQDHGEKEMIRLAFGPEALLHSVILKARKELGLLHLPHSPPSPTATAHHRHSSTSRFGFPHPPPPPLNITSPSWAPPSPSPEDHLIMSPVSYNGPGVGGGGDLVLDEDQLSFLNAADPYQEMMGGGGAWPHQRSRSCSVADLCLGPEAAAASGFGWKPCLYFARGYCKNGTSCRFLHGLPDEPDVPSSVEQQHCRSSSCS
ncbi:putative zinc finger CCCH domain-containing protein 53 [Iris pallida]|uniref:Zinc finger CCCH domain-containing protein 53 n=1 Tax=Iris pallida TaxID=29817 RepID=A0AAX6DG00_IRIPA|nr:putative zinc finger CCCH domain-containing protein 53 [Iris pallida]